MAVSIVSMLGVCLLVTFGFTSAQMIGETEHEVLQFFTNYSTYDSSLRLYPPSKPTLVTINTYVNSISSINEIEMEYTINVFMRQQWTDHRLSFSPYSKPITINYNAYTSLWIPDLFFKNEKKAVFHAVTVPNRLISITPDGYVTYSQRLSLTLACQIDLSRYPMDNQTCLLYLESYGYTTTDIIFEWRNDDPVQTSDPKPALPEFLWEGYTIGDCTTSYITGEFSCQYLQFHLKRQLSFYLIQTYIPTVLIVMLSWVSFWIDVSAVAARISLGLLTVLTMTTQSSGISARLPRVSYIKAIDVWMTTCLAFVFGALVEYSIVSVIQRREEGIKEESNSRQVTDVEPNGRAEAYVVGDKPASKSRKSGCRRSNCSKASVIELSSRIIFPLIFALFNIGYWLTYA